MIRFGQQRRRAISRKMSALGKHSQEVQLAKRLAAIDPSDLADMLANPSPLPGDAIGSLELRNFRSGTISRWTILRGTRRNNYVLRTPDGRRSNPHGLTWITVHLRPLILRLL